MAIVFKQENHTKTFGTASTSLAVTFSSTVTAGSWLLCVVGLGNGTGSASTIGCSDNVNGTYTALSNDYNNGSSAQAAMFVLEGAAAGSTTVTVTSSTSLNFGIGVIEYAGVSSIDVGVTSQFHTSTTSFSCPNVTTVTANDLVLCACALNNGNGGNTSISSGYTLRGGSTTADSINFADQAVATGSLITGATFTLQFGGIGFGYTIALAPTGGAPTTAQLSGAWYGDADPELVFYSAPIATRMWEEDVPAILASIPTLAWDEVDWQKSWDVRVPELIVQDEQPTEIPPIVIVWNPATGFAGADDWDWSQRIDKFAIAASFEHEDWNPTLATPLIFFDEFEDQYESYKQAIAYYITQGEEELPAQLPTLPAVVLKADFDADDFHSKQYGLTYNLHDLDEDLGLKPIQIFVPDFGEDGQKGYFLVIAPPIHDAFEELSLQANFPPPAPPTWAEWGDDVTWQLGRDIRLSQMTGEEDLINVPGKTFFIPTLAWDEIDAQKLYNLIYNGIHPEFHEDQTYGWFLNPFVPPVVFCPLPPFGPDADTSMSIFGGKQPTLALFCRICKSGKPLIVRADYAIWCQDCCAFVSKQDTYMGTIKAPGQFRGIF